MKLDKTPVACPLSDLSSTAALDFADARTLPPKLYHDAEILQLEIDQIFKQEWICIGRSADIPNAGEYLTFDIIDQPVFAIRQDDQSIAAFANVCAHRCAKLLYKKGQSRRIVCPYHSWTYNMDGQLIGAPYMEQNEKFDKSQYRLAPVRLELWEGFIYVTLNPDASSVAERLKEFQEIVGQYHMADYVPVIQQEEVWNTNWKCLFENFMDGYHIHNVHRDSFSKHGCSEDSTTLFPGNDHFTYHFIDRDPSKDWASADESNTWLSEEFRSRVILAGLFPGHTIQLQPDLLWYLSIMPQGVGQVRIKWSASIPEEILASSPDREQHITGIRDLLTKVNSEDKPTVENLFQATASDLAKQGPMSHLERNVYEFTRYLARRLITTGS